MKGTLCPEYFLFGTEGALRKPMTYDDHPAIRASQSLLIIKTGLRLIRVDLKRTKKNLDELRQKERQNKKNDRKTERRKDRKTKGQNDCRKIIKR